jgi:hypothetical protein
MPSLPGWIGEQLNQTIPVKLLVATNNWNGKLTRSSLYLSFSVCLACGQVCCCFCCWGWLWRRCAVVHSERGEKAVLWNRNYFSRFRFRFRFLLVKSFGSGSGSGSDFWKSYGSGSGSGSYFRKVTVPVPFPAPYLDHKSKFLKNIFGIFLPFYIVSCFTRKKFINFDQFFVKCEWKKF